MALRDFLTAIDQGLISLRAACSKDRQAAAAVGATFAPDADLFRTCSLPVRRLLSSCSREKQITCPFD